MLEHLTAKNFIVTLSTEQVRRLFNESLSSQNIVAFSVTFKDLFRRRKLQLISDDIVRAFEDGFKFEYQSSFANTFMEICYDYRKSIPYFAGIHMKLENNSKDNGFFDKDAFFKIYLSGCDNYFTFIGVRDLTAMDAITWLVLLEYETDLGIKTGSLDREQAFENAKLQLNDKFMKQINSIVANEDLTLDMSSMIKTDLKIEERIRQRINTRRKAIISRDEEEN